MHRFVFRLMQLKKQAVVWLLVGLIYALPFLAVPATAALYFKIGAIKGGSMAKGYEDWIESGSFSFGITTPVVSKGSPPSGPIFSDIVITKPTDISSSLLFREAVGNPPQPVDLELVRIGTRGAERYYTIKLYEALVSAFAISSGGNDHPMESISLNFLKMELTYRDYVQGVPAREVTAWYNLVDRTGGTNLAANAPPTISSIGSASTLEDVPLTIPFTIGDAETPASNLALMRSSDYGTLLPQANVSLGGSGTSRTVTLLPAANQTGTVNITITVSDGIQNASTTFALNVTPVEDPPVISGLSAQSTAPGAPVTVEFSVNDPDTEPAALQLFASAANGSLVPPGNLVFGTGAAGLRSLTVTPAPGQTGETLIFVRASDGALETTNSFLLTVAAQPVNQPPAFTVLDPSEIVAIAGRSAAIQRLQVSDPDAGTNALSLALQVVNGTISVSGGPGTILSNGTANVFLSGSVAVLNALLSSTNVSYQAPAGLAGTDLLTATLNDNGHSGSGGPQAVYTTLGLRIYASQYDQWLHEQFTSIELTNAVLETSLWGFHADSDRDGLENVAEYGLGTSPRGTNHSKPRAEFANIGGASRLALQFNRRRDPDLTLTVEVASRISGPWTSDDTQLETVPPVDLGNGFEQVQFVDRQESDGMNERFIRMRWTLNQPFATAPPPKISRR